MPPPEETLLDKALLVEYAEICRSHLGITEFRAHLLALLPIASGTGIFLLLEHGGDSDHLLAIGLFGLAVTLGLFLHELRGMGRCWELVEIGKAREETLHLTDGQFIKECSYYEKSHLVGTGVASVWIYSVVLVGWLYVVVIRWW